MKQRNSVTQVLVALQQRLQVLMWLLLFLMPAGASAVMPPWVYEEARETALFHGLCCMKI